MPLPAIWQGQWTQQGVPGTQGMPRMLQPARFQTPPPPPQQQQQQRSLVVPRAVAQPSIEELVASVLAKLDNDREGIVPSTSNDKLIVDALKKSKLKAQTPRKAIEGIGDAKGYANALWKDYFLDHAEKLTREAFSTTTTAIARSRLDSNQTSHRKASSQSSSRSSTHGDSFNDLQIAFDYRSYQPSSPLTEHREQGAHAQGARSRPRRGDPVEEFHAGVQIPPSNVSVKPKAPRRNVADRRFTDQDKIFFIHFLRWLLHKGPVPEREAIHNILAEQTPHHNADSWKRHWDDYPVLPDKIYIEARKRGNYQALASDTPSSVSVERGYEEDMADTNRVLLTSEPALGSKAEPVLSVRTPTRPKGGIPVTDNDFREMAKYMYERRHVWYNYPSLKSRWQEFGQRPENLKRSVDAWYCVERDRGKVLQQYYDAHAAAANDHGDEESEKGSELEYVDRINALPRQNVAGSSSTSSPSDERIVKGVLFSNPLKRRAETGTARSASAGGGSSDAKRIRKTVVRQEPIEIDSD
ncbi:hypothetical protein BD311DRAFT_654008 [Dichomitus squalens]|uniref:Uncharacterized protein n=1 Tax=Dichomitus squalens TaxID=114155 RepID=A0A4Q9MXM5_9APHY|nr:hypothetical protein BD311DRAFT_654008 [Dichomitus squalens]